MLRDVGWLWALILVFNTFLAVVATPLYVIMYPVLACICIYFTYMRYDENGHRKL